MCLLRSLRSLTLVLVSLLLVQCAPTVKDMRDPLRAERYMQQGVLAMRTGDLDAAHASFSVAAELDDRADALDGLGCIALRQGHESDAVRYFQAAIELDNKYSEAYGHLAIVYQQRGEYQRALAYFKEAVSLDPTNREARGNYAALLEARGFHDLSRRERKRTEALALQDIR
jgi:tetratricopeptide (TPR) repeat protein